MSAKTPQERVAEALYNDAEVAPYGTSKAQRKSGTIYGAIPAPVVHSLSIEQSTDLYVGFHAPTKTVLQTPVEEITADHWADSYFG